MSTRVEYLDGLYVWFCNACAFPVAHDQGFLAVDRAAAASLAARQDDADRTQLVTFAEVMAVASDVEWRVLHDSCEIDPDGPEYWIELHRCATPGALLERTAELMAKRWLQTTDWDELIASAGAVAGAEK